MAGIEEGPLYEVGWRTPASTPAARAPAATSGTRPRAGNGPSCLHAGSVASRKGCVHEHGSAATPPLEHFDSPDKIIMPLLNIPAAVCSCAARNTRCMMSSGRLSSEASLLFPPAPEAHPAYEFAHGFLYRIHGRIVSDREGIA